MCEFGVYGIQMGRKSERGRAQVRPRSIVSAVAASPPLVESV